METLNEFLDQRFYHNNLREWSIALGIMLGALLLSQLIYWLLHRILRRYVARTKTKLDDLLLEVIKQPLVFGLLVVGVWWGISTLSLPLKIDDFLRKVYHVLLVIDIAWLINRAVGALLEEFIIPRIEKTDTQFGMQLLPVLTKIMRITIWLAALILALNNAGYDVGALLTGLGIGGLAFALASQATVANLFGSISIFSDKPFLIGDRIQVGEHDGFVSEIGIRSTRIRTLDNRLVVLPNALVANQAVINITSEPSRRVFNTIQLTYQTPPDKMQLAIKLLRDICTTHPNIEDDLTISFDSFGAYSLNIILIYFIKKDSEKKDAEIMLTTGEINMEILKQFNAHKLDFAYPTQSIFTDMHEK